MSFMKRYILSCVLLAFCVTGMSQSLYHVIFYDGSTVSTLSYFTDQKVIIKISPEGKIIEYGPEMDSWRMYYTPGKLQQYMGRVDHYERQFDSTLNGKIKSIGTTQITYYGSTDNPAFVGKVKSIGRVFFDYYSDFENESVRGKIKTAGSQSITYYSSFENESYRGKMKSLGGKTITYYSTFDDKAFRGKLKSIGSYNYTWYSSGETRYHGGLKSGNINQMIEGVTYILW
jgi:hypothetical protein